MSSTEMFLFLQITCLLGNIVIGSFQATAEVNGLIIDKQAADHHRRDSSVDDDRTNGIDYKPGGMKSMPVRALPNIIKRIHLDTEKRDDDGNVTGYGSLIGGSIMYNMNEENNTNTGNRSQTVLYDNMVSYSSHVEEQTVLVGKLDMPNEIRDNKAVLAGAGYASQVGRSNPYVDVSIQQSKENKNIETEENGTEQDDDTDDTKGATPMPHNSCPGCAISRGKNMTQANTEH